MFQFNYPHLTQIKLIKGAQFHKVAAQRKSVFIKLKAIFLFEIQTNLSPVEKSNQLQPQRENNEDPVKPYLPLGQWGG